MVSREEFDKLCEKVEKLETLINDLANAISHSHNWEHSGHWSDKNAERKCLLCGLHEKYVYPGRPYEDIWEKVIQ